MASSSRFPNCSPHQGDRRSSDQPEYEFVDPATPARTVAPFAARIVLPIAGVVAVAHLALAAVGRGYWFDELYMLAVGRNHLDWGSADQPPVAPALAAAMDWIAPGSIVALRIPAVVASAGAVVVAGLIARELGADRRAQALTAGAQATGMWASLVGHWLTPYTLEPAQWLVIVWLLVRWIRLRDDRLLLALGAVAGVAAMTKFQALLLCCVVLLTVAALGPRPLLRRPLLWVGLGIGALVSVSTLLWQSAHGWPQLAMTRVVADEADALYGGRPGIAVQLIIYAGVAGTVLSAYGLWRLLRADELRAYRFLGATFVVLYVLFVATAGRPYYLAGLYAVLAAAGALGLQRRREAGRTRLRWMVWPAYALSAAVAVGMLVVGVSIARSDIGQQIAQCTADAYHALPPQQRDHTAVMGQSYIVAAYLDGFASQYNLPEAHSTNRSYGYFAPPAPEQDTVIYVGSDPDELRAYFRDVRTLGSVSDELKIWLLTGRREPWDVIWPKLRTLQVS